MRLILLTDPAFAAPVTDILTREAPSLSVQPATTLPALEAALETGPKPARILSLGSGVIVPARLLMALESPAYNLHPGPPEQRGLFPSVFALYDQAPDFGVTLHEMAPEIDRGAIVDVARFAIDPTWDRLALDTHTLDVLLQVLARNARRLADPRSPLAPSGDTWSGPLKTRRDFEALCRLPADFTPEEYARRLRAVGEGPHHALTVVRDGKVVRLDTGRAGPVVRAGQPVAPT